MVQQMRRYLWSSQKCCMRKCLKPIRLWSFIRMKEIIITFQITSAWLCNARSNSLTDTLKQTDMPASHNKEQKSALVVGVWVMTPLSFEHPPQIRQENFS